MASPGSAELLITPSCETLARGEAISVPIVVQLASPRRVRAIVATFHGAEETKATYTTTQVGPKGQVTTQVHTAVEHVDIVKQEWLLAGRPRRGFFGNLVDGVATMFGGGRHQRMTPGEDTYEVELAIPADAPATHEGKRSRVFYEVTVRVDIALGRDVRAKHAFEVTPLSRDDGDAPPQRVCYPDDDGRGLWDSIFEPDLRMELELDSGRARTGDTIRGSFRVDTPKPLDIRGVKVRLVGHEQSEARSHRDSHRYRGESVPIHAPPFIAPSWSTEFALPATLDGPPTTGGKLFSIDWFVEIALDVPWAKDPTIRAPIVLW